MSGNTETVIWKVIREGGRPRTNSTKRPCPKIQISLHRSQRNFDKKLLNVLVKIPNLVHHDTFKDKDGGHRREPVDDDYENMVFETTQCSRVVFEDFNFLKISILVN